MTIDQKALTRPIVGIENRTAQEVFDIMCDRFRLAAPPAPDHADDLAVDRFADAMKAKLKWEREERGRGGWQNMSAEELSKILVDHLPKGDPVDVANLAMMLGINRQQIIMPAPDHAGLVERLESALRDMPSLNHASIDKAMYRRTMLVLAATVREAATALSAQASPAPLEGVTVTPIGYARSVDVDPKHRPMEGRNSFWCTQDQSAYYSVPVYLSAIVGSDEAATVIQTLQRERDEILGDFSTTAHALAAAEQQVRDMRDGLEPFAEFAKVRDDNDPDMPDRMVVAAYATDLRGNAVRITLGDLRRAREALSKAKEGKE